MGFNGKKRPKTGKKWLLPAVAAVVAVAAGCGIWYYMGHNNAEPVYVYPFQFIGMTEYWGDSQESHGPVTTDKIQTVFLSDTQTVTEILVQPGDAVHKGDLLMTFDTTLSDLQLERKRLAVEKLKLQLEEAQKELKKINSMKPMVIPEYEEEEWVLEDVDLGRPIRETIELSSDRNYDGSTAARAMICWLQDGATIDQDIFAAIRDRASYYQYLNTPQELPGDDTVPEEESTPAGDTTEATEPADTTQPEAGTETTQPEAGTETTQPEEQQPAAHSEIEEAESTEETVPPTQAAELPPEETVLPSEGSPEPSSASNFEYPLVDSFHVVFKVTAGNMSLGDKIIWQGVRVMHDGGGYTFRFEPATIPDHMIVVTGSEPEYEAPPEIDMGSGYTAAQIAQMRSEQQKKIKDLEFQIKMADAEYRIMQTEVDDGNVYATIDGEVISRLTEEEAKQTKQPLLKVSGGGGFYVEGFINELEKDTMQLGQEVTVNDWNTGMTYTGTIESIGDFPSQQGYFGGNGNPNASFYPFKVFVDGDADLQAGSYVSVVYSAAESENGIYLENPFLRTEQGRSYVLVLGADGKLQQRFVATGKSLWGNYTQILSGLTAEDLIAFPYGKNVKPGVPAVEGDMSKLYGG